MNKFIVRIFISILLSGYSISFARAFEKVKLDENPELFAFYNENGKFGFMNMAGEIIVPQIYDADPSPTLYDIQTLFAGFDCPVLGAFSCGLARVYEKNRGYGFIDYSGKEVIKCQYKMALPFSYGLAAVRNEDGLWGYIDTSGNVVIPLEYHGATIHREGTAFLGKEGNSNQYSDEKFAIVNEKGEILTDFIYSDIIGSYPFFSEGLKIIPLNNQQVCINTKGEIVFNCPDNVDVAPYFSEGVIAYYKNGSDGKPNYKKTFLMDTKGKTVFTADFDIEPFSRNGFTKIKSDKGVGVMDRNFDIIVPFGKYETIYIDENVFRVKDYNNKWGYLNLKGEIQISLNFEEAYSFSYDVAGVRFNGKYGFINSSGEFIIDPIYDETTDFNDMGYAAVKRGNMYSVIDVEGDFMAPFMESPNAVDAKRMEISNLNAKSDVDVHIPKSEDSKENTLVLIIANEKYSSPNVGNVLFARNDGKTFKEYSIHALGIPEKNIYYCENATLSQLSSALNWLKQRNHIDGFNKAIVYYSGHGMPDYLTNSSYLLPSDGNPLDITTAYSLETFYNELATLEVDECITFIDACFSGNDRRGDVINEVRGISIKPKEVMPSNNVIVFAASQGNEVAQTYPKKHHGMFTYFLLKFLQENNNLNIKNLIDYVRNNVNTTTLNLSGKAQTPTLSFPANLSGIWEKWDLLK